MRRVCERQPVPICAQVKPRDRLYIWVYEHLQGAFCIRVWKWQRASILCCPVVSAPESEPGCGRQAFSFLVLVAHIRAAGELLLGAVEVSMRRGLKQRYTT